jgi:acetolactate synthase-1/2/3 large subunit
MDTKVESTKDVAPTLQGKDVARTLQGPRGREEIEPPSGAPPGAETAERYIQALVAQGVQCLFMNPGTDTLPVQEALSKLEQLGQPVPRTVLCLFELVALAAAHGYYAATGSPQAVLVHVDVGTQNLGGTLHDAQRGRAAVLICAGRTPYTTNPRQRGTRDAYIHWLQEQFDQHSIVRNFVKWEYELRRSEQVGEVVARAFQIAASDPPGPVYLTLPREVLMADPGEVKLFTRDEVPPARLGAGDPDALREVADRLVRSENPLVLTATTGRTREGFAGLLRLAELLALPVVERRERNNFPTRHVLHQGFQPGSLVEAADLILVLDHDVPYIPTQCRPRADAAIVQIDLDPIKERIPLWSFPVSLPIRADTSRALERMADYASDLLTDAVRQRIEARRARLTARHRERREARDAQAQAARRARPIAIEWLSYCIGQLQREAPECVFVDETVTSNLTLWTYLDLDEPGSIFGSGGSGLGWGLGAALGVKLALPDRPVVLLVADGSFVFGEPLAALWASRRNEAPILVVIFNNGCYNATKSPLRNAYPQGYSVRGNRFVGVDLEPAPRYDLLGAVVDAVGERIEDPADVMPALRRALDHVRGGRSVILDVILARP